MAREPRAPRPLEAQPSLGLGVLKLVHVRNLDALDLRVVRGEVEDADGAHFTESFASGWVKVATAVLEAGKPLRVLR